jgi:hypothetical protein
MATDVSGRIRARIASGLLPITTDAFGKLWVGKGDGRSCNGCNQLLTQDQTEYEVDVPTGETLRFHKQCLDAWRVECRRG